MLVEADIDCFASTPTIIQLAIAKQACKFPAAHTVVNFVLLLPCWGPLENARWTLPVIHQRMLDGLSLLSIRECSMDATGSGPIPSSCVRDIHFQVSDLRFVEADIGFLAGTPTIIRLEISITRAKQVCEFPAAHTVSGCILCSCFPLWDPFENARWALPWCPSGNALNGRQGTV